MCRWRFSRHRQKHVHHLLAMLLPMMLATLNLPICQTTPITSSDNNNENLRNPQKGQNSQRDDLYRVFRIFTQSWTDVRAVQRLHELAQENPEIDFWLESAHPGHFADVMIAPEGMGLFEQFLRDHPDLRVEMTVDDVQKLIFRNEFQQGQPHHRRRGPKDDQKKLDDRAEAFHRNFRRDVPLSPVGGDDFHVFGQAGQLRGATYSWGEYTGYSAMVRYMRTLEFYYPQLVQLVQLGTTHEGRSIEGVKIGYNSTLPIQPPGSPPPIPVRKRVFWIDGNMHAREWASGHTALFIINQLVWAYGRDAFLTNALNHIDFVIVPCTNPDGFEYSRSSLKPQIRLWRKNRSPEQCTRTVWGGLHCCRGVDLNRNFDFHWAETGSSSNACSNLFAGKKVFSEPEARAIADFLGDEELKGRVDAFITLHTYAQLWIHPFSHEYQTYSKDAAKLKHLAMQATQRLREVYGTEYRIGTGADLLAPASGGSDDWAKDKLGAKFVYLVELRPQQRISNGFILRQEELLPTAVETFEAIKVVIQAVLVENALPLVQLPMIKEMAITPINAIGTSPTLASSTNSTLLDPVPIPTIPTFSQQSDWLTPSTTITTTTATTTSTSKTATTTITTAIPTTGAPTTHSSTSKRTTTPTTTTARRTSMTTKTTAKSSEERNLVVKGPKFEFVAVEEVDKGKAKKKQSKKDEEEKEEEKRERKKEVSERKKEEKEEEGEKKRTKEKKEEDEKEKGRKNRKEENEEKGMKAKNGQEEEKEKGRKDKEKEEEDEKEEKDRKEEKQEASEDDEEKVHDGPKKTTGKTITTERMRTTTIRTRNWQEDNKEVPLLDAGNGDFFVKLPSAEEEDEPASPNSTGLHSVQFRFTLPSVLTRRMSIRDPNSNSNTTPATTMTTSAAMGEMFREQFMRIQSLFDGKFNRRVTVATTSITSMTTDSDETTATTAPIATSPQGTTVMDSGAEHAARAEQIDAIDTPSIGIPAPPINAGLPRVASSPRLINSDRFTEFEVHRRDREGRISELTQQARHSSTLVDYWRSLFGTVEDAGMTLSREAQTPQSTSTTTSTTTTRMPSTEECRDQRSSCAFWIRAHPLVCTDQMRYMRRNCALTCGFCRSKI